MLPPVEPDEQLIAHGLYQQIRDGSPTRLQEFWTVHGLPDDAMIWRSQLLYDGAMPITACYLLRDPLFQPVQMVVYWRWEDGREDLIEYRFAERFATIVYHNQTRDMILPASFEVYGWHTITEHLLWGRYNRTRGDWQTLNLVAPDIANGTLWPTVMTMQARLDRSQIAPGPQGPRQVSVFAVDMPEIGPQELHFDQFGVPVFWGLSSQTLQVDLIEYARLR
jgi:hypothetical protein